MRVRSLSARHPDLAALLGAHRLTGVTEEPLTHAGFSGAHITRLRRDDGAAFVLKRMSIERDWIMRATDDIACREAAFAAASIALPEHIGTPALDTARDGDGHALLMIDISQHLVTPAFPSPFPMKTAESTHAPAANDVITPATLDTIIVRMAELHALPLPARNALPWCGLQERLTLLTPDTARIAEAYGAPVARDIIGGWALFDRDAPADVAALIRGLSRDPSPLLRALNALPPALLHGDLKLDNIGVDGAGRTWLIDWAMPLLAPPAVELGWFLAINSRRIPVSLDDVMSRYAEAARIPERERHDALTVLCGLLLRGWRKALDAEAGETDELRWWCKRAREASRIL